MLKSVKYALAVSCLVLATKALADITVPMYFTAPTGTGSSVGTVTIKQTKDGLLFTPDLKGLSPGVHGFHIHENPSCADNGMAAGGHFDPKKTGNHLGPYNDKGHLGDLPVLDVQPTGVATLPVLAPRLKDLSEIEGHSLMIHDGGDNYSDAPTTLGGGGKRMVCGIIK